MSSPSTTTWCSIPNSNTSTTPCSSSSTIIGTNFAASAVDFLFLPNVLRFRVVSSPEIFFTLEYLIDVPTFSDFRVSSRSVAENTDNLPKIERPPSMYFFCNFVKKAFNLD